MFLGMVEALPREKTLLAAIDHRAGQTGLVLIEERKPPEGKK